MANIDVQKKKPNPLPWIILVLVILAIAGYFIWRNMENKGTLSPGTGTDTTITRTDTIP